MWASPRLGSLIFKAPSEVHMSNVLCYSRIMKGVQMTKSVAMLGPSLSFQEAI